MSSAFVQAPPVMKSWQCSRQRIDARTQTHRGHLGRRSAPVRSAMGINMPRPSPSGCAGGLHPFEPRMGARSGVRQDHEEAFSPRRKPVRFRSCLPRAFATCPVLEPCSRHVPCSRPQRARYRRDHLLLNPVLPFLRPFPGPAVLRPRVPPLVQLPAEPFPRRFAGRAILRGTETFQAGLLAPGILSSRVLAE